MFLDALTEASLAIQVHASTALAAFVLGALILFRRKGTPQHRLLGRVWVGLMLVAATSAIFINEIQLVGPFSPIHIFVVITYAGLTEAIWHIRKGNVARHRAAMQGLYFGALIVAGSFTFLPGRRMNQLLFGPEGSLPGAIVILTIGLGLTAILWWRLTPRRKRPGQTPSQAATR